MQRKECASSSENGAGGMGEAKLFDWGEEGFLLLREISWKFVLILMKV
jgi:hypothetical protein